MNIQILWDIDKLDYYKKICISVDRLIPKRPNSECNNEINFVQT